MIEGPILGGQRFRHLRTGRVYVAFGGHTEERPMLAKIGRAAPGEGWVPFVAYYDESRKDTFARDEATFRASFERVPR